MKKIIIVVVVILALIITGYYYSQKTVQQENSITIGSFSRAIDYAPYLIAKNKGWFDEVAEAQGLSVNYVEFQSLPPINEAFATDNVDIVFEAEPPAIIGRAAGIGIKIMDSGVSLVQEVLVHKDSTLNEIKDLEGKKIAVLAGSSSHYGIIRILEQAGLSRNDVEIIDMLPPAAKVAFETNQVDAWAIWPPFVEQEVESGIGRTLSGGDVFIQSIVAVRESFSQNQPQLNKDLLAVVSRAQDWILANEAEAQQIVAEELDIELVVVEMTWPKHNFKPSFGNKEVADIQNKADFLLELGLIKNTINVSKDLIDRL